MSVLSKESILSENVTIANNAFNFLITPELAKKWLQARNEKNRAISEELVRRLVKAIKDDYWVNNGQPIIFDAGGSLIDGQHRLTAIARSSKSVESLVVLNIDNDRAFFTLDDGKKRSLECNLSSLGFGYSMITASAGKLYYMMFKCRNLEQFTISTHTVQNIELVEFIQKEPLLMEAARMANRSKRLCTASVMGAALTVLMKINEQKAKAFHEKIVNEEYADNDAIIKKLRDRFFYDRLSSHKMTRLERLALIFKAWNYWLSGRSVKSLSWSRKSNPDAKFPVPAGWY